MMDKTLLDNAIEIELDKIIAQVKEETKENDHNGARQILANLICNNFLHSCYQRVGELHALLGYMPESLIELRRKELDPKLIAELKKQFPEDVDRIKSAL